MATKTNDIIRDAHRLSMAYLNRYQQAAFIRECRRRRNMKTLRDWMLKRINWMRNDAAHFESDRRNQDGIRRALFKSRMAEE